MKKFFILVLLAIVSTQVFAQIEKEIIYGVVRTDGYEKITQGAMWSKRPEARDIYYGYHPSGYDVYVLEEEYYVRFAEGEHNRQDINYIVFPKGEIVYADSTGQFYSAKCGNKIEYIRPVKMVVVVEKILERVIEKEVKDTVFLTKPIIVYKETTNNEPRKTFPEPQKIKKQISPGLIIFGGITLGISIAGLIYCLTSGGSSGGPGGAPTTPPTPGGPGGTPPGGGGGPGGAPV